jgi:DNA uptake protein ComE-like DNA-binding protein
MFNLPRQRLRCRLQQDPFYRFQSWAEVAIAAQLGVRIEVNQARVDDWLRLPGFSIHQARQLSQLTVAGVQFLDLEDLGAALGVAPQQLEPLKPILSFTYCDPDSSLLPQRLPINQANAQQLSTIPYLSPGLINQILAERQRGGPFTHLADLQQRLHLNGELVAQLMHYLQW